MLIPLLLAEAIGLNIGGVITLLVWLLVIGVLLYLVFWVMGQLSVPEPIRKVVTVVVVVVVVLAVLLFLVRAFGLM